MNMQKTFNVYINKNESFVSNLNFSTFILIDVMYMNYNS